MAQEHTGIIEIAVPVTGALMDIAKVMEAIEDAIPTACMTNNVNMSQHDEHLPADHRAQMSVKLNMYTRY